MTVQLARAALLSLLLAAAPAAAQGVRAEAAQSIGFRLDGLYLMNRAGSDTAGQASGAGLFWLYDAGAFLADVSLDYAHGERDDVAGLGLGAYYPFLPGNVSPYVGGGLSYAWLATDGQDTRSGLALRGTAGLLLGRLSTVQFRLEGGWQVAGFSESAGGERTVPNGPYLSVGLAIGRGGW